MSASGVGKTFATMTFRACSKRMSPPPPYECLTIYLGLNQGWDLTSQERAYLQAVKKGKGFLEVERVLLQRLLIALDVTLTKCQGDLNRLNGKKHDGQKIPLPQRGTVRFSEIDIDSVREAIYARLRSLLKISPKRKSGYRLVVLVALDEAQFLDRFIPPDAKGGGGARYGLHALRQLQVLAYEKTKQECLLLPIATGIRPAVSLKSRTEGQNICVGEKEDDAAHVSEDDFSTIVYKHVKSLPPGTTMLRVDEAVKLLSVAFYPCVRRMLEWKGDSIDFPPMDLKISHDVAVKILMADFARTSKAPLKLLDSTVAVESIPQQIPVRCFEGGMAQPLVHFPLFGSVLWCINKERLLSPLPRDVPFDEDRKPLKFLYIRSSQSYRPVFETRMFEVFGLFMSIFCDPRARTKDFRTIFHRVINEWLPEDAWKLEDRCNDFTEDEESEFHYLPFGEHKNHEDALKGPIFEDVLYRILKLKKDCGCWMHFGGEAPVDYMLFVRREGNRMEVRFGDAKYHPLRKNGVTPCDAEHHASLKNKLRSRLASVVAKAETVHAALKRELGKHRLSLVDFKARHVLLFTNVPTDAIELDGSAKKTRTALAAVSPDTFRWSSWTPFVFLDAAGTANAQSGRRKAHHRSGSHSKSRPLRRR